MRVVEGGVPDCGARVTIGEQTGTVVASAFKTHVFRGDVSVRLDDGTLALVPRSAVRPFEDEPGDEEGSG